MNHILESNVNSCTINWPYEYTPSTTTWIYASYPTSTDIEITKVTNGYVVKRNAQTYVFESLVTLLAFIKKEFK